MPSVASRRSRRDVQRIIVSVCVLLGAIGLVPSCLECFAASAARSFSRCKQETRGRHCVRQAGSQQNTLKDLRVAIVGAGPSGLLLAHRLLDEGARVHVFESRSDPRGASAELEGRAYALGLGIRGRTAIRTVEGLWDAVKSAGFNSEKFKLHLPFAVLDLRKPSEDANGLEPSLLVYQSDLCAGMLDELDRRHPDGRLQIDFDTRLESADPIQGDLNLSDSKGFTKTAGGFDLIAGCDGLNSRVRSSIGESSPSFSCERTSLPGLFKVIRLRQMPPGLEDDAVHALPGKDGTSAFVEPTARGACVLINWRAGAGSGGKASDSERLGKVSDGDVADSILAEFFPKLSDGLVDEDAPGQQFVAQKPSRAATIFCNTYHHGLAVLLGDAAHSTGGVSGQGCNSALQDAAALADSLKLHAGDVPSALLDYSMARVPEGHALLELSMGPSNGFGKTLLGLKNLLDGAGVTGSKQLQVLLTTTLKPFQEIRRELDPFFGPFPAKEEFKQTLSSIDSASLS